MNIDMIYNLTPMQYIGMALVLVASANFVLNLKLIHQNKKNFNREMDKDALSQRSMTSSKTEFKDYCVYCEKHDARFSTKNVTICNDCVSVSYAKRIKKWLKIA